MAISPFLIPYSCPFSLDRYLYWLHEFNLIIWNLSWYMHACESLLSPGHLILTIYEQKFFLLGNTINTFVIYLISFAALICKEQSTHFLLKDKTLLVFHMKYRDCRCISSNGIVIVSWGIMVSVPAACCWSDCKNLQLFWSKFVANVYCRTTSLPIRWPIYRQGIPITNMVEL